MNLRALKTLTEIERCGAFAAAANRLGLTISAVSLQMKTLEQELALALFNRSHRPPTLTPAGRRVAAHARAMLREAEAIRSVGQDGDDALHGDYRIGFVATASVRLMPGFLAEARRRHPRARLQVTIKLSTELASDLRAGALDMALVTSTEDLDPDLVYAPIRRESFAVAAPPGVLAPDADGGEALAACAADTPFVKFTPVSGIGALAAEAMRRVGVAPRDVIVLDSVEAVMGCVNAGVGFALLPEPDVRRNAAPGVTISPLPELARELGLAAPRDAALAERLEQIAQLFPGEEA